MSLLIKLNGVELRIYSNDHCPPHIAAIKPSEWKGNFEFSFLNNSVSLYRGIVVQSKSPTLSVINTLASWIQKNLSTCRAQWWAVHGSTCLNNKSVLQVGKHIWKMSDPPVPQSWRVTSSRYLPQSHQLHLLLRQASQTQSVIV